MDSWWSGVKVRLSSVEFELRKGARLILAGHPLAGQSFNFNITVTRGRLVRMGMQPIRQQVPRADPGQRRQFPCILIDAAVRAYGRDGQIRTDDFLLPKQALYQAELRPVSRGAGAFLGANLRGCKPL